MTASETVLEPETFRSVLDRLKTTALDNPNETSLQKKARHRFEALGLPSKKQETYRYIKLNELYSVPYEFAPETRLEFERILPFVLPECRDSVFVFVNGRYEPTLSRTRALPEKLTFASSENATKTFGLFLKNRSIESLKEETDSFAVLNAALHEKGLFLYLAPDTVVDIPVQILHLVDIDKAPCMIFPRLQLFAGARSAIDLVAVQKTLSGKTGFVDQVEELILEEGARVGYRQILCDEPSGLRHFDFLRADLKQNSSLKTICIVDGSDTTRHDYAIRLNGENAEALLNGISLLKDKRESHFCIVTDHRAPACRSYQLFKNVLNDFSRSSFEGKIMVRQDAQKTEAFQLNQNLLLGDRTRAAGKPNLEIFADDVKASHGATFGRLDPDQLFYLKTRGLSEVAAKSLLISGFCDRVVEMFDLPSLKESIVQKVKDYLKTSPE